MHRIAEGQADRGQDRADLLVHGDGLLGHAPTDGHLLHLVVPDRAGVARQPRVLAVMSAQGEGEALVREVREVVGNDRRDGHAACSSTTRRDSSSTRPSDGSDASPVTAAASSLATADPPQLAVNLAIMSWSGSGLAAVLRLPTTWPVTIRPSVRRISTRPAASAAG